MCTDAGPLIFSSKLPLVFHFFVVSFICHFFFRLQYQLSDQRDAFSAEWPIMQCALFDHEQLWCLWFDLDDENRKWVHLYQKEILVVI